MSAMGLPMMGKTELENVPRLPGMLSNEAAALPSFFGRVYQARSGQWSYCISDACGHPHLHGAGFEDGFDAQDEMEGELAMLNRPSMSGHEPDAYAADAGEIEIIHPGEGIPMFTDTEIMRASVADRLPAPSQTVVCSIFESGNCWGWRMKVNGKECLSSVGYFTPDEAKSFLSDAMMAARANGFFAEMEGDSQSTVSAGQ